MPEQLADGVYAIEAQFEDVPMQVYVIVGDSVAVIDPGVVTTPEHQLAAGLKELGLSLAQVDTVLVTHGHHDHFGGNGVMKAHNPNLRVLAHAHDAAWIQDVDRYLAESLGPLAPYWTPPAAHTDRIRRLCGDTVAVDEVLEHGQTIDLGRGHRLHVEHIPGHTDGHVAFFHERGKVLFTGDALQGHGTPLLRRPDFYPNYSSVTDYERSLDYFAACGAEIVGTAHANVCTAHRGAQIIADSRIHLAGVQDFLAARLREAGRLTRPEAVAAVLEAWPRYRMGPNVVRSVGAQLDNLVTVGSARRHDEPSAIYEWIA
ncbi:Hydroxyacylglutathione hydrolase [Streptomyces sp. RB5]|uniref:Hydroxyacylglutathione hydrolase n=1 Tax=Streptomyces smaragdinus TaxID=2585196 RepID=A0A7K0CE55_9ACTN|nr:MBL fold metallo-hydrolase [Streptomyces smaragdinus]MQY11759.1 Hydroxyacylglutathione hydrolase [Streptomyces smaragdinus]